MNCSDIKAAIKAEEQRLAEKFRADLDSISITISAKEVRVWGFGTRASDRYSYQCGEGSTPDEAAERLCTDHFPSPEVKAARLREQARDLLRSAADLEKGGAK